MKSVFYFEEGVGGLAKGFLTLRSSCPLCVVIRLGTYSVS